MKQTLNDISGELRRYLTGSATDEEREKVERALLDDDPSVFEELLTVEDVLIDELAAGELSSEESARFLAYVDALPERSGEVWVASQLSKAPPSSTARREIVGRAGFSAARALMSVAAAMTAMVIGWNFVSGTSVDDASPALSTADSPTTVSVLALTGGRLRSSGGASLPTVTAAPDGELTLRLDLEGDAGALYRAEIRDPDGAVVVTKTHLVANESPDEIFVSFDLSPFVLEPGDYYVELSGSDTENPFEPVGRYDFRVAPP